MSIFREESDKPHFVIVPLAAQGHLIPLIDMGHLLAERGVSISIILTKENANRIKPIIERVMESRLSIEFIELSFPEGKFGLPPRCESIEYLNSFADLSTFFNAIFSLYEPFEAFIKTLERPPSCMITDVCNAWTAPIARKFNIPRVIFHGPSALYLSAGSNLLQHKMDDGINDVNEYIVVPDFPVKLEVTMSQMMGLLGNPGFEEITKRIHEEESTAEGVLINTFLNIEGPFVENYEKIKRKNVWTVGPLCLYNKDIDMKANRGNKDATDQAYGLLTWLNGRDDASVLYINFGSIARTTPKQLMEIGSALEMSNKPFIWVLKKPEIEPVVKKWLFEGFEERTKDRGVIIIGWVPQMIILSHPAVGGFMTHCGWNSALEAISFGVPMITWPRFFDQFANASLIVDALKIGVSLGIKDPNYATEDVVMVEKDCIINAVLTLMDGGVEAKERRNRSKELSQKAKKSMEKGGSSFVSLTNFISKFTDHKMHSI